MFIQELILDGFKSYPVRTTITGWDPSFNAITGLNGSGKSNILDAICFVLGLTNMTSMRAQNQTDLIYKRGQAGVTKASVTIVFDNSNPSEGPVGLEHYPQITVTRQIALPNLSKYLLNGHKSTQQSIQTLFQSVQLNINNPNFLIMQGRITKVLNMRPQEILGMIEEASGTRMFEERKAKAHRDIAKKEKKVQELEVLIAEEAAPKISKLREEKRQYVQWQKSCTELERIGRTLRAWEWTDARQRVTTKQAEIAAAEEKIAKQEKEKGRLEKEQAALDKDVTAVKVKRDKELQKGGKFKKLEEEVGQLGKVVAKLRTQCEIKTQGIADEQTRVTTLSENLEKLRGDLGDKEKSVQSLTDSYAAVKEKQDTLESTLASSEGLLQTLLTGLSSNKDGDAGGGYLGQIAKAEDRLSKAHTEQEQAKIKLDMANTTLETTRKRWKSVEKDAQEGARNVEAARVAVENLKREMAKTGWSAEEEQSFETALRDAKNEVRQLKDNRDSVKSRVANLDFEYSLPHPNFDRNRVKGLVANLVALDQVNYNAATALEITAGGRLYNVVVETADVGKQLLQNGRLKRRVTLIPLDKIQGFCVSPQKIAAAERLSNGKARLALSLVGYTQEVAKAMFYVFGGTFICDDAETANKITFSREVGTKCVTLNGDIYDPSGTLSGGAAPNGSGLLVKVQALLEAEGNLQQAMRRLAQLEREEQQAGDKREKWRRMARDLSVKEHELGLKQQQVDGSNASRIGQEVEKTEQEVVTLKADIEAAKAKQKEAKAEVEKLKKDMNEFKNNKDGKTDELKADIKKQKAAVRDHAAAVTAQQRALQTARLEFEQAQGDIGDAEAGIESAKQGVTKLSKELNRLQAELKQEENSLADAERKLQEERATLKAYDDELKALDHAIKEKKEKISQTGLEIENIKHGLTSLAREKTAAENQVASLEKQYDWIVTEQGQFGKAGTQYDFRKADIDQLRTRAQELEAAQSGMKKKVNPKSLHMLDGAEKNEESIKKMIATINRDKEKMFETIETLDQHKRESVEKTWKKVDSDFGAIFGELLPGNYAKLQPPDGQDLMQGLEVKVRLGTVWKQSLTELSGGQRSLIALSLIMSLLQYKPAPMYILDEIDAALDLSHTQHIGQLFRTRFKGSQFIVVSLKEGLFTNANVLFRTRFRDGTSIVERTANRSASSLYQSGRRGDEDENVPPEGRRRR